MGRGARGGRGGDGCHDRSPHRGGRPGGLGILEALTARCLAGLAHLISGAQVRWAGCAPSIRPRVYFANHGSHLDFIVLWAALPPAVRARTRPVAAVDYWRGGLKRWLALKVFRSIPIERRGPDADGSAAARRAAARETVRRIVRGLGRTRSLIVFPEGGRRTESGLGPFKSGLYHLCRARPELELVPVYLENLNRVLPKGEFLPVPLLSSVTFGVPFRLRAGEGKAAFLARARRAILALGADR